MRGCGSKWMGLLLLLVLLTGCEPDSDWGRIPVEGSVTLDGAPFDGAISFRPQAGTSGPSTMTNVQQGRFQFDRRSGPVPGPHLAILIVPDDETRMASRIDTPVTVPTEAPFTMSLDFTTPVAEPEVSAPEAPILQPESAK